jgi:phosphatidylglycerol:prolipoprotein diacylglycerol transferase
MYPILLKFEELKIYSYSFFIFLGFFISTEIARKFFEKKKIEKNIILDLMFIILISGIFGGRLFSVLQNAGTLNLFEIFKIWESGLVFYGGFIFALIFSFLFIKYKKLNFFKISDIIFLVLPLGHAFGRIGCYLSGCCYGIITDSKIGVRFPKYFSVKHGIIGSEAFLEHLRKGLVKYSDIYSCNVYPTQIISAFGLFLLFFLLLYFYKRNKINGLITSLYLIFYSIFRFLIEFIREEPKYTLNLSAAQIMSIILFVLGVCIFYILNTKFKNREK